MLFFGDAHQPSAKLRQAFTHRRPASARAWLHAIPPPTPPSTPLPIPATYYLYLEHHHHHHHHHRHRYRHRYRHTARPESLSGRESPCTGCVLVPRTAPCMARSAHVRPAGKTRPWRTRETGLPPSRQRVRPDASGWRLHALLLRKSGHVSRLGVRLRVPWGVVRRPHPVPRTGTSTLVRPSVVCSLVVGLSVPSSGLHPEPLQPPRTTPSTPTTLHRPPLPPRAHYRLTSGLCRTASPPARSVSPRFKVIYHPSHTNHYCTLYGI